ncbi:MAG TPA: DUF4157 domain-containing protein [Fibrobacteria bacterium]|nr:DUF4157 domain-containing protein [Fibrobacteria bacterium]
MSSRAFQGAKPPKVAAKGVDFAGTSTLRRGRGEGPGAGTLPSSPRSISIHGVARPDSPKVAASTSGASEQEADQVAASVVAKQEPSRLRHAGTGGGAGAIADSTPEHGIAREAFRGGGQPLDPEARAFFEPRLGADFGSVRIHSDASAAGSVRGLGARAFTVGSRLAFDSGQYSPGTSDGKNLLGHELAHVIQQRNSGVATLQAKGKPGPPSPTLLFEMILSASGAKMTDKEARDSLDQYRKMTAKEREATFQSHYPKGFKAILGALPAGDAGGAYAEVMIDVLRKVEEVETRRDSGLTNDEIAAKKGKDLKAVAIADAAKKKKKKAKGKVAAPTAAEIESAKDAAVADTSIGASTGNRWTDLNLEKDPKKARDAWTKRGNAAIAAMVAHAAAKAPSLKLSASDFDLDFFGVDDRGQGVLAMGGTKGGKPIAAVGFDFVTTVEVDPAYALSTVVHEIFGHPQFGPYGTEYHLSLYDSAEKKAGFKPKAAGSSARTTELDAYAYQETEIYSNMRELPFFTAVGAADAKKDPNLPNLNPDPKGLIADHIGLVKKQWSGSGLDVSLLHGLWSRYSLDPRIAPVALDAFKDGLKANGYSKAQIVEITK